jgi:hypothetical protein
MKLGTINQKEETQIDSRLAQGVTYEKLVEQKKKKKKKSKAIPVTGHGGL